MSHQTRLLGAIVVLTLALVGSAAQATLLSERFGVSPTLTYIDNWNYGSGTYSGYQFDYASLAPTKNLSTVDYNRNDWFGYWSTSDIGSYASYPGTGTYPQGAEPYDVEAVYFDDDGRNMYISIITSYPSPANGIFVDSRNGATVVQGDLAINFGLSGSQSDASGFRYNYGVDLVNEVRPGTGNVSTLRTNTVGSDVYRTTGSGQSTGAWYLGTPTGAVSPPNDGARTNFDPTTDPSYCTSLGSATTSWYQLALPGGVQENNYDTWVIEATIPLSYFPRFEAGKSISYLFLPGCRNDGNPTTAYMTLNGDLDMPEPGTYALLALGMLGIGWQVRRRRATKA